MIYVGEDILPVCSTLRKSEENEGVGMSLTDRERQVLQLIEQNPLISQNDLAQLCGITRSGVAAHVSNLMKKGYIQGKGYVVTPPRYVAVIGAINMDVYGLACNDVVGESSNVGHIVSAVGGIARNISFNLGRLGVRNFLISVYGDDEDGEHVRSDSFANGIDITHCKRIPASSTSRYLSVVNADGQQIVGLDDMGISEGITPDFLQQHEQVILKADAVVVDSSLPAETLAWVCGKVTKPIYARVVSVNKAARLLPVLGEIDTLVLSEAESQLVSGVAVHDEKTACECLGALADLGVKSTMMFVKSAGLMYQGENDVISVPLPDSDQGGLRFENGAASGALSALLWARWEGFDGEESLRLAASAASLSMRQITSVYPELSTKVLLEHSGVNR